MAQAVSKKSKLKFGDTFRRNLMGIVGASMVATTFAPAANAVVVEPIVQPVLCQTLCHYAEVTSNPWKYYGPALAVTAVVGAAEFLNMGEAGNQYKHSKNKARFFAAMGKDADNIDQSTLQEVKTATSEGRQFVRDHKVGEIIVASRARGLGRLREEALDPEIRRHLMVPQLPDRNAQKHEYTYNDGRLVLQTSTSGKYKLHDHNVVYNEAANGHNTFVLDANRKGFIEFEAHDGTTTVGGHLKAIDNLYQPDDYRMRYFVAKDKQGQDVYFSLIERAKDNAVINWVQAPDSLSPIVAEPAGPVQLAPVAAAPEPIAESQPIPNPVVKRHRHIAPAAPVVQAPDNTLTFSADPDCKDGNMEIAHYGDNTAKVTRGTYVNNVDGKRHYRFEGAMNGGKWDNSRADLMKELKVPANDIKQTRAELSDHYDAMGIAPDCTDKDCSAEVAAQKQTDTQDVAKQVADAKAQGATEQANKDATLVKGAKVMPDVAGVNGNWLAAGLAALVGAIVGFLLGRAGKNDKKPKGNNAAGGNNNGGKDGQRPVGANTKTPSAAAPAAGNEPTKPAAPATAPVVGAAEANATASDMDKLMTAFTKQLEAMEARMMQRMDAMEARIVKLEAGNEPVSSRPLITPSAASAQRSVNGPN